MLIKANAIPGRIKGVTEEIKKIKQKMGGLSFKKVQGVNVIQDGLRGTRYSLGDELPRQEKAEAESTNEEDEEAEDEEAGEEDVEMDVDRDYVPGASRGMSRQFMREHYKRMEDSVKANWQMQEVYQYYHWQHNEQMRDM